VRARALLAVGTEARSSRPTVSRKTPLSCANATRLCSECSSNKRRSPEQGGFVRAPQQGQPWNLQASTAGGAKSAYLKGSLLIVYFPLHTFLPRQPVRQATLIPHTIIPLRRLLAAAWLLTGVSVAAITPTACGPSDTCPAATASGWSPSWCGEYTLTGTGALFTLPVPPASLAN
jgi:hypothetical protein